MPGHEFASTVARTGMARAVDPRVPHTVHAIEVGDIAQPDHRGQQFAFVGACHGEIVIDFRERSRESVA